MIRFLIATLATAGFIAWLVPYLYEGGWLETLPTFYLHTLILVVFATVAIFTYLYRLKNPGSFTQFYLLLMVLKIVAFLAYNLVMVMKSKEYAAVNVVFFLIVYFIFTGLEIAFLYFHVSAKSEE